MSPGRTLVLWRRRRDSNPRDPFGSNGFQDRRFQPLTHSSVFNSNVFCELAANLLHWRLELLHFGAGCSKIVAVPASFPTATTFEAIAHRNARRLLFLLGRFNARSLGKSSRGRSSLKTELISIRTALVRSYRNDTKLRDCPWITQGGC